MSNFWYLRGGLERVMLGDAAGLEARGHAVGAFASAHPLNHPSPYSGFFPPSVDHAALGRGLGLIQRGATAVRLIHNPGAVTAFEGFLRAFRPDVVHQHGIARQLSPSVLERAHAKGIPTVLTVHDYAYRCPKGVLSRPDAPVCLQESCAGHRYDRAVRFRCVHDSRAASAVAAVEVLLNRALRRFERSVDLFLVPSEYSAARLREAGLGGTRVAVVPNAIDSVTGHATKLGSDVVAYGRLVDYKGFDLLVDAARLVPDVQFIIGGDGPARISLEARAAEVSNITFIGALGTPDVTDLLRRARVVVVPSQVPETFGMVVLEAWSEGRPVIVTDRGALPEVVTDGLTGIVTEASPRSLAAAIRRLVDDDGLAVRLGQCGLIVASTKYSMASHLELLETMYRRLLG